MLDQSSSVPNVPTNPPQRGPAEGRDARGRFTKNNKGGPGNPFARRVASLRQVLLDTVTDDDMRAIAEELIALARQGELAAIKLLLAYVIGKPTESVNPDTLDAQEWQLYQQAPVTEAGLQTVLGGLPTPLACEIARSALPAMHDQLASQIGQALQPPPEPAAPPSAPSPSQTVETEAAKTKPAAERRAPRTATKRRPAAEATCPTCLGLVPGPCPTCGRNTEETEGEWSPAQQAPAEVPPALAALARLLAGATEQARQAGAPSPNGANGQHKRA
jgi:hypothetical protein